jgi:FkbM family methyltransferase
VDLATETVVDIGVNHGQFLYLARRLWPAAKIVGVEPNAALAAKAAAIFADDNTVTVESCAVGAGDGEIEFFVTANDQNSSIHQPSDAFHDDRADDGVVRTEKVPLRRLDGLLDGHRGPMLLKIDVQGANQYWPCWLADLVELLSDVFISEQKSRTYDGLWLREPGQYLHNTLPRACSCLDRYPLTELHPAHAAA